MPDEQFNDVAEAFSSVIDGLLSSLDAPDAEFDKLVYQLPRVVRRYRDELRRTATVDSGSETDMNGWMADTLRQKVGFLMAQLTLYRQRRGLSLPKESFED